MNKKRGLGRGLDALLGGRADAAAPPAAADDQGAHFRVLPVDLIQRGRYQPRLEIKPEALEELAASIRVQGLVQPVVVRPLGDTGRFELIAGERRWRAVQLAGLHEIPAIIKDIPDQTVMSIALIENIQREQLTPIEEALAIQRLLLEFEMTHQTVAEAIGRSRASVSNLLRLLDLGQVARNLLESGLIEMGHARALLSLPADVQGAIAERVAKEGLSVRETEKLVRASNAEPRAVVPPPRPDPNVSQLESQLSERLGAAVAIRQKRGGKGTLEISYGSLEELDGILAHIQ